MSNTLQTITLHGQLIFTIDSFNYWRNKYGPHCLPPKNNGESFLYVDTMGNRLESGADFRAANEIGSYPVSVYRVKLATHAAIEQHLQPINQ